MTSVPATELPSKFRRFGPAGLVYEILEVAEDLPDGDKMLRIRILETGEVAEYRLSHAIEDPEES